MTQGTEDAYLKSLQERGRLLADRETALAKQEADLREERAKLENDRASWKSAMSHYSEFLHSQGQPTPENADLWGANIHDLSHLAFSGVNLRVGEKRGAVLKFIAKQSEAGQKVTTREITEATGLDANLVGNVTWSDRQRGYLIRAGGKIGMTAKGFEFVSEAGIYQAGKN